MTAQNALNISTAASDLNYLRPIIWAKKVYEEAKAKMFWNRFAGPEGSGMPVILKTELLTEAGYQININQMANLSGAGVSGESQLRGNEEALTLRQISTNPEWYRHAVAASVKGKKQITNDFRQLAMSGLSYWMAKKMDASMWTAARVTAAAGFEASTVNVIYANDAESVDTIDSADTFGVTEIRQAAALLEANNIDKVRVAGLPGDGYYICFIHPYQAYDLKADSDWISNHQNASERSKDNPLFTGALGEIDGVIVHSTTQCTASANGNSPSVNTARAMVVGQEALCRGLNEDIVWSEQIDDYEFTHGIGIRAAWEDKILSSNALIQVVSAAVAPS